MEWYWYEFVQRWPDDDAGAGLRERRCNLAYGIREGYVQKVEFYVARPYSVAERSR